MKRNVVPALILAVLVLMPGLIQAVELENPQKKAALRIEQINKARGFVKSSAESKPLRFSKPGESGGISGSVIGLKPADISTAYVFAYTAAGDSSGGYGISSIQPDGTYLISGLPAGKYFVYPYADGYMVEPMGGPDSLGLTVIVADGQETKNVNFKMIKLNEGTASLKGRIVDEKTGEGIPDASVNLWSAGPGWDWVVVNTDKEGYFLISDFRAGSFYLSVYAQNYLYIYYPGVRDFQNAQLVYLTNNQVTDAGTLSMKKGGTITGKVVDQKNDPVSFATILGFSKFELPDSGVGGFWNTLWAFTDENGDFGITAVEPDSYKLMASTWTRHGQVDVWYNGKASFEEADEVVITEDETVSNIDFTFDLTPPTGAVFGTVTDLDGNPIEFASAVLYEPCVPGSDSSGVLFGKSPKFYYSATNENGEFSFEEIMDGVYYLNIGFHKNWSFLSFWYPGVTSEEEATEIVIENGAVVSGLMMEVNTFTSKTSISGIISDENGKPLTGAYVYAMTLADTSFIDPATGGNFVFASAATGEDGTYLIEGISEGSYYIQSWFSNGVSFGEQWYDGADSWENAKPVTVSKDENITGIDITIPIQSWVGSLSGIVTDEDGNPLKNAYVELTPYWDAAGSYDRYFGSWNETRITNENGEYLFENLYKGLYTIAVYADGGYVYYPDGVVAQESEPIEVLPGLENGINIKVPLVNKGKATISGVVTTDDPTLIPVNSVVIAKPAVTIALWPQSEIFYPAVAIEGNYSLKGLPAGEYYLYAFSNGLVGEFYDNTYDPVSAELISVTDESEVTGINFSLASSWRIGDGIDSLDYAINARMYGKVHTNSGDVISDASIHLMDEEGSVVMTVKSNAKGFYEMAGIPAGKYSVQVVKVGMEEVEGQNAPVDMNKNVMEKNFILKTTGSSVDVGDDENGPSQLQLVNVYPNPFNPATTISFRASQSEPVTISIYSILGELVKETTMNATGGSLNQMVWNGTNSAGLSVSSGIYLFRIQAGNQLASGKMILAK